jgi:hypothetical protein
MVVGTGSPPAWEQRSVMTGFLGRLKQYLWKRKAQRMSEEDIGEVSKRLIIIKRQIDGMSVTSSLHKLRMELLIDRERCQVMIAAWEARQES